MKNKVHDDDTTTRFLVEEREKVATEKHEIGKMLKIENNVSVFV